MSSSPRTDVTLQDRVIARLRDENDRLKAELASRDSDSSRSPDRQKPAFSSDSEATELKVRTLTDRCLAQEIEIRKQKSLSEDLRNDLRVAQETIRALDERNLEQSRMISSLQERLNQKQRDMTVLEKSAKRLIQRHSRKKNKIAQQKGQIESLTAQLRAAQRAESDQTVLTSRVELLEAENQKLEAKLLAAQSHLRRQEATGLVASEELAQAQTDAKRARQELEQVKASVEQSEEELAEAKSRWEREVSELNRKNEALEKKVQEAAALGQKDLREKVDAQAAVIALRGETLEALSADLEAYSKENGALKQFVVTLLGQIESAHQATQKLLRISTADQEDDQTDLAVWEKARSLLEQIAQACDDIEQRESSSVQDWNADASDDLPPESSTHAIIGLGQTEMESPWILDSGEEEEEETNA
jgi:chromosome segregation ATPase